ncbi:hypothetical protein PIB30_059648 [Stylosanthes scabra]|uniref:Uncharacterized protein n=1 Tax=Stylosanthes scabra TaxID=79078 RepID=A0ABU6RKN4_9FABA|nr:hypothetical protein [Stylosanthes scabra]
MTLHGNVQECTDVLDGVRVALTWTDVMTVVAEKPHLGFNPSSRRAREADRRMSSWPAIRARHASYLIADLVVNMGSGIIHYEYEKREKFGDYDLKADADLGTFKIRRYHFDDESFVHPPHSVRFVPDRPYEIPIEALMADQPLSSSRNRKTST